MTATLRPVYLWSCRRRVLLPLTDVGQRDPALPPETIPPLVDEEIATPDFAAHVELDRAIIRFVRANPGCTQRQIAQACGWSGRNVLLVEAIQVFCWSDGRSGQRKGWYLRPDWDADL